MKYKINDDLFLRTVSIDDANDIFEFASNDIVTEELTWNTHKDIEETKFVITNFYLTKINDELPNSFVIVDNNLDKVIGVIDFAKLEDEIHVGYFLNPIYWQKGIMTKALEKLLEIGFVTYNFEKIFILHNINNIGSKKVILNNGFKYISTQNEFLRFKNNEVTTLKYVLSKGEFNGN